MKVVVRVEEKVEEKVEVVEVEGLVVVKEEVEKQ